MMGTRAKLWLAGAVAVVLVVLSIQDPLVAWVSERCWSNKPSHLPNVLEREILNGWRAVEMHPAMGMVSTPFVLIRHTPVLEPASITVENTSSRTIHNVWFYRRDMPNFYSTESLVESVTSGKKTETEKVMALWALFPKYYYNYYPLDQSGILVDPPTLLAVLGSAQCNYAATVLETLCQMVGCETRLVGIELNEGDISIAHCAMEVKADGRWIYMDPDGHVVYRRADGDWAGVQDLLKNPDLVKTRPHAYYNTDALAKAFAHGSVAHLESDMDAFFLARRQTNPSYYSCFHHVMRYDLLPGSHTTLFPGLKGRHFGTKLPRYCNGVLKWSYRPEDFARGSCQGVVSCNLDIQVRNGILLLQSVQRAQPAYLILPQSSPYLMVGGRWVSSVEAYENVLLYVMPFVRCQIPDQQGWSYLGVINGSSNVPFDNHFESNPIFAYALKIEIPPSGAVIHSMAVQTWLQASPKALPYLTDGENHFILYGPSRATPSLVSDSGSPDAHITFENGLRISFTHGKPPPAIAAAGSDNPGTEGEKPASR